MSTSVEQCKSCAKLFPFLARGVCGDCLQQAEEEFERVRDYVREHEGAPISKVAEETEVSERRIVGWMNEGRLERYGTTLMSPEEDAEQQATRKRLLAGIADAVDETAAADEARRRAGMRARRHS